jgi:hypothetical protein
MTLKPFYKKHPLALAVLAAVNVLPVSHAAVNFTGTYAQNFDTLTTSTSSTAWSNDSTLPGWYLFNQTASGTAITGYVGGAGAGTTGSFYSFGATGASDRALGGLGSGGTYFGSPATGAVAGWIAFAATNNSGSTINTLNVAFNGEQWRNGGNASTQAMVLEYGFGATFTGVTTWNSPGGAFNWTSPVATLTDAALDGNVAGLVSGKGGTLNSLNWTSGSTLWVRWVERNDAGTDHGLAIDNFSLSSASPAGVTITQSGGSTELTEGGANDTYTVVLNSQPSADVNVNVTGNSQATVSPTTLTFTALNWNVAQTVTVSAVDDALVEGNHTATISHAAASSDSSYNGLSIASVSASITDNDTVPTLSINDVSQSEGNSGTTNYTFTVSLSTPAPAGGVTFDIATANNTASAASDYAGKSLTNQSIAAGQSSYSFTVAVNGDTAVEADETFFVNITNVIGATAADAQGQGIIVNDDVASACGSPATKISAIQGSGSETPVNVPSAIEGIVVGDYQGVSNNSLRGFFVQEEDADADGNSATSEGIFVFEGTNPPANVKVGDRVRVNGTPTEFFNMTQLSSVTKVEVCANNQSIPTPATLTLPVPGVPNGDLSVATAAINSYFEAFEGMLVKFPTTLKVSEYFELERFGQLVLSQGGRIPTFTNVSNPSVAGYTNHQITLAKRQIILDDGNNVQNFYVGAFANTNNIPLPYPTGGLSLTNRFRGGDSITNLTGVLHWSFAGLGGTDAWRIRPVEELYDYAFTPTNPRKTTAPKVGGSLKVASFNVLNYFTTIDTTASNNTGPCSPGGNQDCRGADSVAELSRQSAKAAQAICGMDADIVGLMEIENNATASVQGIADASNAVCGAGTYSYINTGTIGTDAIKVALLYKPATVAPLNPFKLLTSAEDARFIDTKSRPALAQTFAENASGEALTIVVNHLKSKGSDCIDVNPLDVDLNDGQGNCNPTRKAAAEAMVDWLASDPTNSGDDDFLIIGDLNSYAKEDPIKAIEKGADGVSNTVDDYTNLVQTFGGNAAYSYVFDGQTGYLDHALASKSLLPQVSRVADWHINADEPPSFDYNDTIQDTGEASFEAKPAALPLYAANPFRTSDHDPVLIGLNLAETVKHIKGTAGRDTLIGTAGKDRITGFGAADKITGGLGNDEFVFTNATNATDGIDTITDFTPGQDRIDLAALLLSLGYTGDNPIADGFIKFANSGNNTLVYVDADGNGPAARRVLLIVLNISAANLNNASNFKF